MPATALFVHRSVGMNMLADADVRSRLDGVALSDLDANTNTFSDASSQPTESLLDMSSGNTNPDGLADFFARCSADQRAGDQLAAFDVVAFKSCYTASGIDSDDKLDEYRDHYLGPIADWIADHPRQRFVVISPPPRRRLLTSPAAAKRAREFSQWLATFAADRRNVEYLDLFGLLADDGDLLARSYRRLAVWDQHPNERGSRTGGERLADTLQRAAAV